MTRRTLCAAAALAASGCASTASFERRIAALEQENARLRSGAATAGRRNGARPISVQGLAPSAPAVTPSGYGFVATVDDRGDCSGALCLEVENALDGPVTLTANGYPVLLTGPGGLLPSRSHAYLRFLEPGPVRIGATAYDTYRAPGQGEVPLATPLFTCVVETRIGSAIDLQRGGRSVRIEPFFCHRADPP